MVGGADPLAPYCAAELALLGRKVAAGADFVQTQMVFDPAALAALLDQAAEGGKLAGELQVALDSRVVIEQAKGVLVGRHGLTTRQAFDRLRRQARDQRRPLSQVARDVVSAAEHR